MTEYVTVTDVEIISAGRAWQGGSEYYVTAEHLADMVKAQDDPLIRAPRVKLGHWDTIFGALAGMHDPAIGSTDGEPGFGTVTNLRLVEGGAKIIGDLTEVPDWLAAAMPSAYPTRSSEWVWDYETAGGHRYSAVLTDLALGGVWEPAVEDLADITRAQATEALAAFLAEGPEAALAVLNTTLEEPAMATRTATASVSVDNVVSAFEKWAWGDDDHTLNTYWWWARDVRVDPDEVIASDGEGGTYRVPFTTDGEMVVTFGEPVEVRETYVDIAAATAAASAAQARHEQRVLASDLPRPERPAAPGPASAAVEPNQEVHMDDNVREVLVGQGLDPDTATEEQINAASVFAAAGITPPVEHDDDPPVDDEPDPEHDPAAVEEPRTVTVSQEVYDEQQRRLEALETRDTERDLAAATQRRDRFADQMVTEGRITPAERALCRSNLDIDEAQTVAAYSALTAGRVPVIKTLGDKTVATASSADEALLAATLKRHGLAVQEA